MKLYFAPGSCSQASHIALHESELPFETEKLIPSTMKTEGGADFMEICASAKDGRWKYPD